MVGYAKFVKDVRFFLIPRRISSLHILTLAKTLRGYTHRCPKLPIMFLLFARFTWLIGSQDKIGVGDTGDVFEGIP